MLVPVRLRRALEVVVSQAVELEATDDARDWAYRLFAGLHTADDVTRLRVASVLRSDQVSPVDVLDLILSADVVSGLSMPEMFYDPLRFVTDRKEET